MSTKNPAITTSADVRYKFIELSVVTDDSLETAVNQWVARGWKLDGIYFVTSEASRRPSMAFVSFVRPHDGADVEAGAGAVVEAVPAATADAPAAGAPVEAGGEEAKPPQRGAAPEEVSEDESTGVFYD